jgi:hypothetical protein
VSNLSQSDVGSVVLAGVVAGAVLAAFEVTATAFVMGTDAAVMPMRMAGAVVLGSRALEPGYPVIEAVAAALIVDLAISVLCAALFTALVSWIPRLTEGELLTTTAERLLVGIVFGVAVWLVTFYVVAPLAGWNWFPDRLDHVVAFLGHGLFGASLGLMTGRAPVAHARMA